MSPLAKLPEINGFFSYAREDDESYRGRLSALRTAIQHELSAQLGRTKSNFRLFQDKEAIAPGRLWKEEIKTAIEQSVFFIPIITPRAVNSEYCRLEFDSFLAREQALGRNDLVFPIIFVPVPSLKNEAEWRNHSVLSAIAKRQYVDWQTFRFSDVLAAAELQEIARLCNKIVEALHRSWLAPEGHQQEQKLAVKRQVENEVRKQQAEFQPHAEAKPQHPAQSNQRRQLQTFPGHTAPIYRTVFSPDGSRLLTFSKDLTVRLWKLGSEKSVATLVGYQERPTGGFNSAGNRILTDLEFSNDFVDIRLWDGFSGTLVAPLAASVDAPAPFYRAMFSPAGDRILVSPSREKKAVQLLDSGTAALIAVLPDTEGASAAFSPDGRRILTGNGESRRLWDAEKITEIASWPDAGARCFFSPDGSRLLNEMELRDGRSGAPIATLTGSLLGRFNLSGHRVLTLLIEGEAQEWKEKGGSALLWDARTGTRVTTFAVGWDPYRNLYVRFSADGRRLVTKGAEESTARVRDSETGNVLFSLGGHTAKKQSLPFFSPDGSRVGIASEESDGTIRIWNLLTGEPTAAIANTDPTDPARFGAFSSDGRKFVTFSRDIVRVWDATGLAESEPLVGHAGRVLGAVFTPDQKILSWSEDNTARLWEA